MKQQAFNPYLPSWEYIPDGEPYVFDGRVYIYGSHDRFNGHAYCLNDYVTWSAPVDDLGNWRYEGVIYEKTQDPFNADGSMCLYAPDVTQGPDGRYYLYYVLDKKSVVSVAVCDSPAGKFQFYGYVHYADGTLLGEREGDEPQFDPGVLTEGENTYLYTGFCFAGDKSRHGPMCTVLGPDMLTIRQEPVFIAPSQPYSQGSGFEGHEFFEAPSIRKAGDTYYFIYSSVVFHELCYATSKSPTQGFQYGGVIISNNDLGIGTYKPADKPMYYGGNNHGSMVQIGEKWYIFYHRQTNGTSFSRQAMAQEIQILPDGSIPQVEMTSCGLNGGPLVGKGTYPAHIACNLFCDWESTYSGNNHGSMVQIGEKWYIFYHRQTNGTSFSRQAMAQEIQILPDGSIPQVEMTSCGLNGGPLVGKGTYPAHIACNLFCDWESTYSGGIAGNEYWVDVHCPRVTQDGRDGDQEPGYILNMIHSATAGYKYFHCQGVTKVTLRVRGYCSGAFQIKTSWDGPVLGEIPVRFTNVWKDYSTQVELPDGVNALYFTYVGPGSAALLSFTLE